jgi:peptidylamidoglycolate lyase
VVKKRNILYAIVLIIAGVTAMLLFLSRGAIDTVTKSVTASTSPSSYTATVLWPIHELDVQKAGSGSGVAVDSGGNVLFLHRASHSFNNKELIVESTIVKLDPLTGEVLAEYGDHLFKSPHGITVDHEDNIWVTDIMLNKVIKLDSHGQLLQSYGDEYPFYMEPMLRVRNVLPRLPIPENPQRFARPTDVVVTEEGDFIVSDGYRHNRVAKFDASGELIWELNELGNKSAQLHLPHGITTDTEGRLYVADRKNARIQVLSPDGEWLSAWEQPELGRPYGVEVGADGYLYAVDGGDELDVQGSAPRSQVIKLNLQGEIIARWGHSGNGEGEMNIPHDIAVDAKGNIYVADLNNNRVLKFAP